MPVIVLPMLPISWALTAPLAILGAEEYRVR